MLCVSSGNFKASENWERMLENLSLWLNSIECHRLSDLKLLIDLSREVSTLGHWTKLAMCCKVQGCCDWQTQQLTLTMSLYLGFPFQRVQAISVSSMVSGVWGKQSSMEAGAHRKGDFMAERKQKKATEGRRTRGTQRIVHSGMLAKLPRTS